MFGGQQDSSNQRVIVNQPATDTDILQFNQPHGSGDLVVNDETGNSGRDLSSILLYRFHSPFWVTRDAESAIVMSSKSLGYRGHASQYPKQQT